MRACSAALPRTLRRQAEPHVNHCPTPPPPPFCAPQVNELLTRDLADAGYAGVEIRNAPMRTEIIIRASRCVLRGCSWLGGG